MKARLLALLDHRRLPLIAAVLAMLFTLPGLWAGLAVESPRLRWLYFHEGPLVDFPLPEVGGSVRVDPVLPGADLDFFQP